MNTAIFLDRDGVIVANRENYIRSWDGIEFLSGALTILARIKNVPEKIVIITNQSVVGRGIISKRAAEEINERLSAVILKAGGRIDGIYMCPHSPADQCDCRKPKAGLLLQAAQDLQIDLSKSIMIGDALTDIEAGQAAGVKTSALLKTGRGKEQLSLPHAKNLAPFPVFSDITAAINTLILSGGE